VSRDTPALAFGVNYSVFKEPLLDRDAGTEGTVIAASVEPTLTFRLGRPAKDGDESAKGVRVNPPGTPQGGLAIL
jgi:hypothetical protein